MKLIPALVTRKVARSVLVTQKNSPALLFGAGIVGVIGTIVMASRATLHLEEYVDEINNDLEKAVQTKASHGFTYTDAQFRQDRVTIIARGAGKIIKLYGPTIILGAASIAALAGSQRILNKRNAAVTAAFNITAKAFKDYRERVVAEFGEEKDREFSYGAVEKGYAEDTKNGVKVTTERHASGTPNEYSRFFDETNPMWVPNAEHNLITVQAIEKMADKKLKSKTYLLLNDVYSALGMEETSAGSVVGWAIGAGGDDYVDFGLFENNEAARRFVNRQETAILLNFNVQGLVYDLIDKPVRDRS